MAVNFGDPANNLKSLDTSHLFYPLIRIFILKVFSYGILALKEKLDYTFLANN